MLRSLSSGQVAQFLKEGFLIVENVLSLEEVAAVAWRADGIAAGEVDTVPETSVQLEAFFRSGECLVEDRVLAVRKLYNLAVYDPVMWGHAISDRIVDIIADLLDTDDIKLYGDQLFMKAPEVGTAQGWHQDSASWRDILPMDLVTAWTALDDATEENGCLQFALGTQSWGMLRGSQLGPFLEDLNSGIWPTTAVPLKAGSISFHHSLTLHRSGANQSQSRRRGYAVHYMRALSFRDESVMDAPNMPAFKQIRGRSFCGRV